MRKLVLVIALLASISTAFDLFSTIYHSPNLSREGNPIARVILDTGKPLWLAYLLLISKDIFLIVIPTLTLLCYDYCKQAIPNRIARAVYFIWIASPGVMVIQQHISGGLTWW